MPAIYPNGFLPLITTDIDDLAVGWGVRGKLGGWDADVSLVYGSNEVAYGVEHSLNTSYGAASQTSFDAGAMKYDQLVFNAGIVRTFDVGNLPEAHQRRARHRGAAGELFDRRRRAHLLRPRPDRRRRRRRAGLPGLPAQQ